jgi:excisionase family DNA binding protein
MANINFPFPVNELAAALAEQLSPFFAEIRQPEAPQVEKYLTRKETADLLNVSLPTLNAYTKTGKINACRFGVRVLYRESEIHSQMDKTNTGRACHA